MIILNCEHNSSSLFSLVMCRPITYQCISSYAVEKKDRGKSKCPLPHCIMGMLFIPFLWTRDPKKNLTSLWTFVNAFTNNSLDASRIVDRMSCKPQEESSQQNHSQNYEGKKLKHNKIPGCTLRLWTDSNKISCGTNFRDWTYQISISCW